MIIKNRYLLSLISETLNRLSKVKYFIKLNSRISIIEYILEKMKTMFYTLSQYSNLLDIVSH